MQAGMKRALAIQFRKDPLRIAEEQEAIRRQAGEGFSVDFLNALETDFSSHMPPVMLAGYDAVLFGGSGDYDFDGGRPAEDPVRIQSQAFLAALSPLFSYIFEHDIPTFGICYGHQIIGAWRGARVHHDPAQHKVGTHTVVLHEQVGAHPLFESVPREIRAQYGHKDVLDRVPPGATLLAHGGKSCQVSALQYRENIFTTQFHPEMTADDMRVRLENNSGYLPPGACADDLISDSTHATQMLRNFFSLVASRSPEAQ